ncbi:MAG: MMPL family transporter [Planctomycetes bacterium]|nr:MMPL family transporter [Planctomycetota bacterium]
MYRRLADLVLGHRLLATVALATAVAVAAGGLHRLAVDFSVSAFFGDDDPERLFLDGFRSRWGPDDDVLVVVVEAEDGAGLLAPGRLRRIQATVERLRRVPEVLEVEAITTVARMRSPEPDTLDLRPLIESMPEGAAFHAWRQEVLAHPIAVPTLLSPDGRTAAIAVEVGTRTDDLQAVRGLVGRIHAALEDLQGIDGLRYAEAGLLAQRSVFYTQLVRDQGRFIPLAAGMVCLCLALIFRRPHGVLVPAVAAAVPTVMVFGLMGWCGEPVGLLNQALFTLLPVIAVADAIHMVGRFHEELRLRSPGGGEPPWEVRREALARAFAKVGVACLLTSLTTAVGFLSLCAGEMSILRRFGAYAAAGIVMAYGTVLLIVPLLLSSTRGPSPRPVGVGGDGITARWLLAVARPAMRHPWRVMAVTAALGAAGVLLGGRVVVDTRLTGMLSPGLPISHANRVVDRQLGGFLALYAELRGEGPVLEDPALLAALREVEEWARGRTGVRAVTSPATYLAMVAELLTGERAVPVTPEAVAQYYLILEGDRGLAETVSTGRDGGRLLVRTQDLGARAFAELAEALDGRLRGALEGLPVEVRVTGTNRLAYRGFSHLTLDLRDGLILAIGAMTAVFGLLFRRPRIALVCLVPNVLPLVAGLGLMGALGWPLELTPAAIFTVVLGLAVDDTLHLMARTREELRGGSGAEEAVLRAIRHTGDAVVITSVILCGGLGVNLLSSFRALVVLGALGTWMIFIALVCDLVLLPALLAAFGGDGSWGRLRGGGPPAPSVDPAWFLRG